MVEFTGHRLILNSMIYSLLSAHSNCIKPEALTIVSSLIVYNPLWGRSITGIKKIKNCVRNAYK